MQSVMRWVCVMAVIAISSSFARAEPEQADAPPFIEHGFVGLGLALSQSPADWTHAGFMLQGGAALPGTAGPFRARAHAFLSLAGTTVQSDWSGKFVRAGGGAEVLTCSGIVCGVLDLDAGYQYATLVETSGPIESRGGLVLGPRIGVELGGQHVRFRGLVELYRWRTHDPSEWMATGGLSLELALRF
jgi:hypothetical protein